MTDLELRALEREGTDYARRFRARVRAGFDPRRAPRAKYVIVTSVEPRLPDRGNPPGWYGPVGNFLPGIGYTPRDSYPWREHELDFFACEPHLWFTDIGRFVCGYRDYGTAGPYKPDWRVPEDEFPLVQVIIDPVNGWLQWKPR